MALDNALLHLAAEQLPHALIAMGSKLKPGGQFLASIRNYDKLIVEKPAVLPPAFYGQRGARRIVHQVWDWTSDRDYTLHLYITLESAHGWNEHHFVSPYRCLLRGELSDALQHNGFHDVRWLVPDDTGFYQPIVVAVRSS